MTKITDIHTGEYDLLTPFLDHLFSLSYQIDNGTVTTASPGKGNSTKRTEIITSILHFQKVSCTVICRHRRDKRTDAVRFRDDHLTLFLLMQVIQVLHDIQFLLSTEHQVHTIDP